MNLLVQDREAASLAVALPTVDQLAGPGAPRRTRLRSSNFRPRSIGSDAGSHHHAPLCTAITGSMPRRRPKLLLSTESFIALRVLIL